LQGTPNEAAARRFGGRGPEKVRNMNNDETPQVEIDLNSDLFSPSDSEALMERLRSESDLRVRSDVAAYATVDGSLPPDVILNVLYTVVPVADLYAGILASALWDAAKGALKRQNRADSEVSFSVVKRDANGRILGEVSGRTSDPDTIKQLIRQVGENAEDE
jgi:hypothetical protein